MNVGYGFVIRKVKKNDNKSLEIVLSKVMREFNVPETGTALADPELKCIFETYNFEKSQYYVLEKNNIIYGGAGISKLKDSKENICELQKMYFLEQARGKGLGEIMIDLCISKAIDFGFDCCYIETMFNMYGAQKLYKKKGFKRINNPLGNTGHSSCPVWMIKDLK